MDEYEKSILEACQSFAQQTGADLTDVMRFATNLFLIQSELVHIPLLKLMEVEIKCPT